MDCEDIKNEIINPFGIPSIATIFIKGIIACGQRKINILIIEILKYMITNPETKKVH
ncbi:hypothetical protein ACO3TA_01810 [Methanocaldococcus sp. 28A]